METHVDPRVMHERPAFLALAAQHYENFPVGSFLVPKRLRPHIHRIYAFARTADDIADEHRDAAGLRSYRQSFVAHLEGGVGAASGGSTPQVPLFQDLRQTIHRFDLPPQLFLDLLDAFAQDLDVLRYEDDAALFDYCRRSADPVGRLVLRVFGQHSDERDLWSDRICTGLQLLNHLQDIREDLVERDRIYFPVRDLERFGVAEDDLRADTATAQVKELVRSWTDRVAGMFREGWPLVGSVRGRLRLELRGILHGAGRVLFHLRRIDHDVLAHHVRLSGWERVCLLGSAVLRARMPAAFRGT